MGFAGATVEAWPRPRAFPRPEALERPVDVLPGVGPAVKKKLAKLGLERIVDLVWYRPFRYEEPVDEKRIAELSIDEEALVDVETHLGQLERHVALRADRVQGLQVDVTGRARRGGVLHGLTQQVEGRGDPGGVQRPHGGHRGLHGLSSDKARREPAGEAVGA